MIKEGVISAAVTPPVEEIRKTAATKSAKELRKQLDEDDPVKRLANRVSDAKRPQR